MYRLLSSGEIGAPCGVPFLSRRARFAAGAASPVVLLDRHLQPRLHPTQHPPVTHPTGDALEQLGVRSLAEVVRPIRVHDLAVARARQPMRPLDRIVGASSRPIGGLLRGQVRLDHRRQHQQRRRLRHPIPQTRNAQCPILPALFLRNPHPPNRLRPVGPFLQLPRQSPKPPLHAPRLNVRHRLAVHPGRPAIAADLAPGNCQHIVAPHLQRMEPMARSFLRFRMEHRLESPNPLRGGQARTSPHLPSSFLRPSRTQAPSLHRHSPASSVLRTSPPPHTARPVLRRLPVGACHATVGASRAASIPLFCVPSPFPRRNRPVLASLASRPIPAFPVLQAGRLPHYPSQSLLGVHPRCGPQGRRVAFATRLIGVLQSLSLPPSTAPTATGRSDGCRAGFAPARGWRLARRTATIGGRNRPTALHPPPLRPLRLHARPDGPGAAHHPRPPEPARRRRDLGIAQSQSREPDTSARRRVQGRERRHRHPGLLPGRELHPRGRRRRRAGAIAGGSGGLPRRRQASYSWRLWPDPRPDPWSNACGHGAASSSDSGSGAVRRPGCAEVRPERVRPVGRRTGGFAGRLGRTDVAGGRAGGVSGFVGALVSRRAACRRLPEIAPGRGVTGYGRFLGSAYGCALPESREAVDHGGGRPHCG